MAETAPIVSYANAKKLFKYVTDPNNRRTGKDVDAMGTFPGFKDIGPGTGRHGGGILGSGPGGAAATARKVAKLSKYTSELTGDPQDGKNVAAAFAVEAQERSIQQRKEVRAIYAGAAKTLGLDGKSKQKKQRVRNQRFEEDI
jgi:hypothetical protein